jgi:hypothetical protein
MAFSRSRLRSNTRTIASIIISSVLRDTAKERVGFVVIRTLKTMQLCQTSRLMLSGASALMLWMPPSKKALQLLLALRSSVLLPSLVTNLFLFHIALIPLMKQGLHLFPCVTHSCTYQCARAHIAQWCAKSNWPMNIVRDHQFKVLMKTGRPGTMIPSPMTVSCNIKIVFERCRERINKILKVC